jgi:glucose/arabinose dehydrogenase
MNTDTLSRIGPDGRSEDIVSGLPGRGDHQANHPVVGPDGKLYFGVGSVTNAGVVGPDNFG